ncbi:MAG: hypothetical protein FD187_1552 [bacterium]|nr:MAG: hypothetical protein FD142_211 [bacterium]KAF0149004.1 MAG: hypothetical protein FD187_1552 [bacterium]KAF0165998.1 MAG: hypothetical protein FD158_2749 [bacterium]TXT17515.1 MAG: hypothetical protein FD132_2403 [bacterium]
MRTTTLIAITLLSLPVHAAQLSTFNKDCVENESAILSVNVAAVDPKLGITGEVCHMGQLSAEDMSYVEAVQPTLAQPVAATVIEGEVCQYGQLTPHDLSFVEAVQPAHAVKRLRGL